jgi:purine-binding chemotaxis protein CheW
MNSLVQSRNRQGAAAVTAQIPVENKQYLTFMLGGEMFAIAILGIKEIIEYENLTEVPMMPECIRGVINLRGSVVPVMDLSSRFGKSLTAVTKKTCIIIVEVESNDEGQDMGVVVDSVNAVLEIPSSEIEPGPAFGAKIRTDFIEGMGKVDGKFVIILNVDQVMSIEEIGAIAGMTDASNLMEASA